MTTCNCVCYLRQLCPSRTLCETACVLSPHSATGLHILSTHSSTEQDWYRRNRCLSLNLTSNIHSRWISQICGKFEGMWEIWRHVNLLSQCSDPSLGLGSSGALPALPEAVRFPGMSYSDLLWSGDSEHNLQCLIPYFFIIGRKEISRNINKISGSSTTRTNLLIFTVLNIACEKKKKKELQSQ